jgi:hypothetical protein
MHEVFCECIFTFHSFLFLSWSSQSFNCIPCQAVDIISTLVVYGRHIMPATSLKSNHHSISCVLRRCVFQSNFDRLFISKATVVATSSTTTTIGSSTRRVRVTTELTILWKHPFTTGTALNEGSLLVSH